MTESEQVKVLSPTSIYLWLSVGLFFFRFVCLSKTALNCCRMAAGVIWAKGDDVPLHVSQSTQRVRLPPLAACFKSWETRWLAYLEGRREREKKQWLINYRGAEWLYLNSGLLALVAASRFTTGVFNNLGRETRKRVGYFNKINAASSCSGSSRCNWPHNYANRHAQVSILALGIAQGFPGNRRRRYWKRGSLSGLLLLRTLMTKGKIHAMSLFE